MELQTKYITLDDFKDYFGLDLQALMRKGQNPSNEAQAFLKRIENRMSAYLNSNFHRNVELEYPIFSQFQKEHYKLALLEQAYYVFKEGDVSIDSGRSQDTGLVISRKQIESIIIAPNAENELVLCGLWCTHLNETRNLNGWFN